MTQQDIDISPARPLAENADGLMPNLFVIGASKSGSTALNRYLRFHPQVFMSETKEPCFFVDQAELTEAWPIMARNPASHDLDAYKALFRDGAAMPYRGEASVYYSQSPHRSGVAERMAAAVPDARIIYVVREPVSRAISHYWQRAKEFQDQLPLAEALREHAIYRDTSDYALQLANYLKVYDRDQIRVILAEDLRNARRETLAELFAWLGIDDHDYPDEQLGDVHVSSGNSRRQRFGFVKQVRDSALWAKARQALPTAVVDRLRDIGTKSFDKKAVDESAARDWLKQYFAPRIDAFEEMLGRSLDAWRK